jgi:menaquinol-cytochrome c reductase iron-sulfur subunit
VVYLLYPLRRKSRQGDFDSITRLGQLPVGVPQAFPIIDERVDAWVKYPREPVGSVWLIRQPAGAPEPVIALSAECPHLGCAVNLAPDGKSLLCPCHTSNFDFQGKPLNKVPPRPMDRLEVKLSTGDDHEVLVKFQRFRTQSEEKIPLAYSGSRLGRTQSGMSKPSEDVLGGDLL